jgi:hypothetical protein
MAENKDNEAQESLSSLFYFFLGPITSTCFDPVNEEFGSTDKDPDFCVVCIWFLSHSRHWLSLDFFVPLGKYLTP